MTQYINLPIDTDPEDILADANAYIKSIVPGWNPAAGNLDGWILQAVSSAAAESRDVASAVSKSIFRYFGATLVNLPPITAQSATAQTTWTLTDTLGHTIPDGTHVQISVSGDLSYTFKTVGAAIVLPGSNSALVTVVAVVAGAASSGIGSAGGQVDLIDPLSFVSSITQVAATSGGVDAETDDDYLDRLADQLKLLAPRPIIPSDFESFAEQIPGVTNAVAIDGYNPPVNEVQTVTVAATGGTFTLTLGANTTAALAWNITAGALQTALQGLASIGSGNVFVSGGPGATAPLVCTFVNGKAGTNMVAMTSNSASLTGGTHTATVATVIDGASATTGNPRMITIVATDAAGNTVSNPVKAAILADLLNRREVNFVVNVADQSFNSIAVTVNVHLEPGFSLSDVSAAVAAAVTGYINSVPLGGTVYIVGIEAAVFNLEGVANVQVTTPSSDVVSTVLQKPQAATPTVGTF